MASRVPATPTRRRANPTLRAVTVIVPFVLAAVVVARLLWGDPPDGVTLRGHRRGGAVLACPSSPTGSDGGAVAGGGSVPARRAVFFFGTRPEIIKLAPVIEQFRGRVAIDVATVFTGQHPDLMAPFKEFFKLDTDLDVSDVMDPGQSLGSLTSRLVWTLSEQVEPCPGDVWIVQGDTTSALAAGLVAFSRQTPIAHVEAGLRTYDMYSPFPEEMNRRTLGPLAHFHFAPTALSRRHLLSEGVDPARVFVTGNTVIDATRLMGDHLSMPTGEGLAALPALVSEGLRGVDAGGTRELVLLTMHRRENADNMDAVYDAIRGVDCPTCAFVVPVHPNPSATASARRVCEADSRFMCCEPLGYAETHWMLSNSYFVLTDSGGLQEESTWYSKPTLVLRESTERPEAVNAGTAVLVGADLALLRDTMTQLLAPSSSLHADMSKKAFPFGSGHASEAIYDTLVRSATGRELLSSPLRMIEGPGGGDSSGAGAGDHAVAAVGGTKQAVQEPSRVAVDAPPAAPDTRDPVLCTGLMTPERDACSVPDAIAVVMTVFKRNHLAAQLDAVYAQTMRPRAVYVVQNGKHVDVTATIAAHRASHADIPLYHVVFEKNTKFHGRFHVAYMAEEEYISVWDDDLVPGNEWLQFNVERSKELGDALIGGEQRIVTSIMSPEAPVPGESEAGFAVQSWGTSDSPVDFVGHTWTFKREHLRYYLADHPFTYTTGEDMQISFSLQKRGILTYGSPQGGEHTPDKSPPDQRKGGDEHASYLIRDDQYVRQLLVCRQLEAGWHLPYCTNCDDTDVVQQCIRHFEGKVAEVAARQAAA